MKPSRFASVRAAKYAGKNTFSIYANIPDIEAMFDEITEDIQAAARPAAQAMAQVLYEAVRVNVAALGQHTGNLYNSIYQAFSPENSGPGKATYHISWRTSGSGTRAPHGHLIEFGHFQKYKAYIGKDGNWYTNKRAPLPTPIQIAARPFIRPASSHFPQALDAGEKVLLAAANGVTA
jgi:hypothetical protein